MEDTMNLIPGTDLYKVLRLVMVNSGSAAYIEIPLDQTAALLSKNNKGKTSALNALKLFLLPEVNFKACEKKFGFASRDGMYSGLDSFTYYFPSSMSFIILEATNPRGDFCIVLHQTPKEELGYSRLAVPRSYDSISHLFWDSRSKANQGMGCHPEGMGLSDVQKCLKVLGGVALTDQESIRTALYTRVSLTRPETRFCMMPLVQLPRSPMMRSIKALLQLSFDIKGADAKNLPLAIANIIDSDVSTGRDPINIDFKKIQADRQRLRQDANHIQSIKGHRSNWELLVESYRSYGSLHQECIKEYRALDSAIQRLMTTHQPKYLAAEDELQKTVNKREDIEKDRTKLQTEISSKQGERKPIVSDLERLRSSIQLAKEVIVREKPSVETGDPLEIARHLQGIKIEDERELKSLEDKEAASHRLQELLRVKSVLKIRIQSLEDNLASDKASFLSYLEPKSALVLNSINPNFKLLTVHPMYTQLQAVRDFSELFEQMGESLAFCGEALPNTSSIVFDLGSLRMDAIEELRKSKNESVRIENKISEIDRILKASGPLSQQIIDRKKRDIQEIGREIEALTSFYRDRTDEDSKSLLLEILDENTLSIQEKIDSLNEFYLKLSGEEETARNKLETIGSEFRLIKDAGRTLNTVNRIASDIFEPGVAIIDTSETVFEPSPQKLSKYQERLDEVINDIRAIGRESIDQFRVLISAKIVPIDPDLAYRDDLRSSDFFEAYQKLRSEFENIETKEKEHCSQIRNHNHETNVEISMLDSMARAITNFEGRINTELESIKISNLSSVRIKIETLDGFNTLRRELENHGSTSDQLMADSFYERLADFCQKYLTHGASYGKLDLEKIVTGINFVYEINGRKESTSQSNGTNGMVNAVLLAILMRRLVPEDVTFTLPVIFDEIGSLDEDNLPELRRVVEDNNFILLVANPNNNGYIAQHIGRWHDIYLYRLTEGEVVNKCFAIYLSDTEYLERISSDFEVEDYPKDEKLGVQKVGIEEV